MRLTAPNIHFPVFAQLGDGASDKYPRAFISNSNGTIIAQVDLTAIVGNPGAYLGTYLFTALGDYSIRFAVYTDLAHTIIDPTYSLTDEIVRVTNLESNLDAITKAMPVAEF